MTHSAASNHGLREVSTAKRGRAIVASRVGRAAEVDLRAIKGGPGNGAGQGAVMQDVGEDVLLDVSGVSLHDLKDNVEGSGLAQVLDRILAPGQDGGHHGFNSHI